MSPLDQQETWTTRKLLDWTTKFFARKGIDSPRLATEMLLAHVLGVERLKLYMDPDRPASELERAAFREMVERAAEHEPVDYLVGQSPFFSMMLKVSPSVLIPRPCTETLVEHVVQHSRRTPGFHGPLIADIGTGSGAIAIALAKQVPQCRVIATDISPEALAVARHNAVEQGVDGLIDFREGDLLHSIAHERVRYLISNPPYISDREWLDVESNVKEYEPVVALRGGYDGLDYIKPLIERAQQHLDTPAQLVLEIAASQKEKALELAANAPGLAHEHVLADHEGLPRVLIADAA
jgi:release factor glutamine methyltransferase